MTSSFNSRHASISR